MTTETQTKTEKINIAPCLWFNKNAEEAANFYAKTFPKSRVTAVLKSPTDYPNGKAGDVLTVKFTVLGQPFVGMNGRKRQVKSPVKTQFLFRNFERFSRNLTFYGFLQNIVICFGNCLRQILA